MPPGVHIGPGKNSTLVRDAQRKKDAKAADEASAMEMQQKYHEFIKAVEDLRKGDYVKLRDDDYKLLQRELEAFSKIEVEECYASPWEDCMGEPMVGKAFRVIHACGHTGQLIISALQESIGSSAIRESLWSERFVNCGPGGDCWLLPATAFQKLKVEVMALAGRSSSITSLNGTRDSSTAASATCANSLYHEPSLAIATKKRPFSLEPHATKKSARRL